MVQYEDDQGNPKDAVSAFQKLATVDKVPAVLGPFYSGNVLACAQDANRLHVVLLTGSATSDNVRNAGDYVFRTCPSNDEQARTIADSARPIRWVPPMLASAGCSANISALASGV